ncbi:TrmH family RNA methyltransferase [Alcaligenes endophyticus]|uniref:RNA methyltransferase n=1 Tax=Alcaligenes endophyticus TaxID=1929088 RepID=A0ABT8EJD3_9BURK|nr:RNA methyltransferase [Alcaligenes endophyticus]MCX5591709.1 RNA methyltransferase [Alcaligenes endophyticus]MDN4121386.1 RNA methyltransferase [Alcaligenes endophyticus]
MKLIESRDNAMYKRVLKLVRDKREQVDTAQYIWLEGIHLCQMWLEHKGLPELAVFEHERVGDELVELLRYIPDRLCVHFSAQLMSTLRQVVGKGQGVGFVVRVEPSLAPVTIQANALLLDQVQDPGNVGTLLRTAAACGIQAVYLSKGCASVWSQKVLRSAQGAHFSLRLYEQLKVEEVIQACQVPLLVTSLAPDAQDLYASPLPKQALWVVGNEGQGVSVELQQAAALRLFIPQAAGVESLNVSIAAALCLYEQYRQHRAS